MSDGTKIEWTDATWNPITGCSVTSPGCKHCYAMLLAGTRLRGHPSRAGLTVDTKAGPVWTGEVRFNEAWLDQPLRWKRPRMIFVCAHGDLFHEDVPDAWIDRVFAVMALCPQHIFQVLTKRADRMREYLADRRSAARILGHSFLIEGGVKPSLNTPWPLPNVWLGVSVEDQARADQRIPDLLATPAAMRWLSCEPLLGPVDLTSVKAPRYRDEPEDDLEIDWRFDALTVGDHYWFDGEDGQPGDCGDGPYRDHRIDWVVAGGESGLAARPTHTAWVRALRDQCASATLLGDPAPIPFFFKQWGEWLPEGQFDVTRFQWAPGNDGRVHWWQPEPEVGTHLQDAHCSVRVGKKVAGRTLDYVQHDGFPVIGERHAQG